MPLIKGTRTGGAVGAAIGTVICVGYVRHLISQAQAGIPTIEISGKTIFISIGLTVAGLFLLAFGEKTSHFLPTDRNQLSLVHVIVLLTLCALSFLAYAQVMDVLHGYGYS